MGRRRSPSLVLGNRRREYTATHGSFRTTHGESRYHPKVAGWTPYADAQYPWDVAGMRSSPKKRIFLSPMQNYFGAFHRGDGGCADRSRRVDAADGCRRTDCVRLPSLYSRHRSEHGSRRAVRQHHLLRIRCLGRLCACHTTRTVDVLRLAQAISAEMVPLTADGGDQGRERRLPRVFELRRAVARRTVPGLHRGAGQIVLDPRRHLSRCVTKAPRPRLTPTTRRRLIRWIWRSIAGFSAVG